MLPRSLPWPAQAPLPTNGVLACGAEARHPALALTALSPASARAGPHASSAQRESPVRGAHASDAAPPRPYRASTRPYLSGARPLNFCPRGPSPPISLRGARLSFMCVDPLRQASAANLSRGTTPSFVRADLFPAPDARWTYCTLLCPTGMRAHPRSLHAFSARVLLRDPVRIPPSTISERSFAFPAIRARGSISPYLSFARAPPPPLPPRIARASPPSSVNFL